MALVKQEVGKTINVSKINLPSLPARVLPNKAMDGYRVIVAAWPPGFSAQNPGEYKLLSANFKQSLRPLLQKAKCLHTPGEAVTAAELASS